MQTCEQCLTILECRHIANQYYSILGTVLHKDFYWKAQFRIFAKVQGWRELVKKVWRMFFKRFLKISHTFLPWGTGSTEPSFFYGFLTKHLFINLSLVCTFWYKEMHYIRDLLRLCQTLLTSYLSTWMVTNTFPDERCLVPGTWPLVKSAHSEWNVMQGPVLQSGCDPNKKLLCELDVYFNCLLG